MAPSAHELNMALQPRIIEVTEQIVLRPARATLPADPHGALHLLRAATTLIPDQPTTEQWQIIKNAILELHHAG